MPDFGRASWQGRERWMLVRAGEAVPLAGAPWMSPEPERGQIALDPATLAWLPPTVPSKVIGIGRNYARHAKEHGAEVPPLPLLFLKAPSSLLCGGSDVVLPRESAQVELEGELAVVIGRRVRRFAEGDDVAGVVLGYLAANDVTARDLQRGDGQWARGKSFDTFCPIAPVVRTEPPAPGAAIETTVNGERRQHGRLDEMTFGLAALLAHVSAAMTLEPGDLLLTGTPAGVGPMRPGDRVIVSIEGLPPLEHGVRAEG
jgi:2-keto-4-pentenoate hydratase/2-oxohepta-3-ene-1,7-dioic acid hydratase in catechol pathway